SGHGYVFSRSGNTLTSRPDRSQVSQVYCYPCTRPSRRWPAHDPSQREWHIDTTVIRLLDGSRVYLHAVIDNFSRRILAWRVAETFAPANSVAVLVEAGQGATPSATTPVVLADAGVENVNAQVDELITTGVLRRVLAFTELKFSNSMIEAWWRSLKHQWLFLHSLDSVTTV